MTPADSRHVRRGARERPSRQFSTAHFPTIRLLLRGYLHEDFMKEHGSVEAAVRAFATDASAAEVASLLGEWRRMSALTAAWTTAEIGEALTRDLGGAWRPGTRRELAALVEPLTAPGP